MKNKPKSVDEVKADGCLGSLLGILIFGSLGLIFGAVYHGFFVAILVSLGCAVLGAVCGWFFGLWMELK